jgi:hypothetical protein
MLRTRPSKTRLFGNAGAFAPDEGDASFEEDGLTSGEAVRLYGGRSSPWTVSVPKDLLQELVKQQMAIAWKPPGERARVLMASRVWEHLRDSAEAERVAQHIVALELHELQSMWMGLSG